VTITFRRELSGLPLVAGAMAVAPTKELFSVALSDRISEGKIAGL
jgi:hypothetical protein